MKQSQIVAITYANKKYAHAARLNKKTAVRKGKVDKAIFYTPEFIDISFKEVHKDILDQKKGNGYWLWKPYFILNTLNSMEDGDILIYTDSTILYIDKAIKLVDAMRQSHTNKMFFSLGKEYIDAAYTKRDTFILMDCDYEIYYNTPQVNAAMLVLEKDAENVRFCEEWLQYASDARMLTDIQNTMGKDNYPEFKMHRHDQSILSLLAKKYECQFFRDPSQWGWHNIYSEDILTRSIYPQIFNHHRVANAYSKLYVRWKQTELAKKIAYKRYLMRQKRRKARS